MMIRLEAMSEGEFEGYRASFIQGYVEDKVQVFKKYRLSYGEADLRKIIEQIYQVV
jgi:hypothetical protein